ncbi:MAG: hypothetical protein GF353_08935 [Candidatus Lokiarchaeota archaeon]|nr:hypothetical protein [Candidatus Lokiarchaeota archaeon]
MESTETNSSAIKTVKVAHDLKRRILEVTSLIRVINNYYHKKKEVQNQIKPLILRRFKEGLRTIKQNIDWLFSLPTALNTLSDDFASKSDSFRFPDSIILFEAWMNLGMEALYPRMVLHFKFPGMLKGEKTRNLFQFIYSTSRGFGFPLYFGPEFYGYTSKYLKIFEPLLRWSYTVCHKANQAIFLVNKKLKSKRHHPGEFESVIISEYENKEFKGINTLFHGYFTGDSKSLGHYSSIKDALQSVLFSYTIGDHAMSVESIKNSKYKPRILEVPVLTHEEIVTKYDIDFYSYIERLIEVHKLIVKKIIYYRKKRKRIFKEQKLINKIKYLLNNFKIFSFKLKGDNDIYQNYRKLKCFQTMLNQLKELLWITPLYTHTIHKPKLTGKVSVEWDKDEQYDEFYDYEKESSESVFFSHIRNFEKKCKFRFEDVEVLKSLKNLKDRMGKMWLFFKERQFRYAVKRLENITMLKLEDPDYEKKVNDYLDKLIPIISLFEIFNRPLSESVYPESIAQTKRIGAYLAKVFTLKYNPFGMSLIKLFNNMAFNNWSYFIVKRKFGLKNFFNFILNLPIWDSIPSNVKEKIYQLNYE